MSSPVTLQMPQAVALMFPGQGSQFPGMGADLRAESTAARAIFERADDILGYALTDLMCGESADDLDRTVHTQPAVFVHSMALLEAIREHCSLSPVVAAGHSLGEYSALCAAGIVEFDDALDIIRIRAEGMDRAQPAGTTGMAAIVGLKKERVLELVETHRGDDTLEAANFNAPDQVVVSGAMAAVNRISEAARAERRTKVVVLPVSAAFHTSLMEPARETLLSRLEHVRFKEARFPVVANLTAQVYPASADEMRQHLADQVVNPVRWAECVETMKQSAAEKFLEIGPGKVLCGLLRRIDRSQSVSSVSNMEDIRSMVKASQ